MQTNANKILGSDKAALKNWTLLELAQTLFDKFSEEQQSFLMIMLSLDCSPKSWMITSVVQINI